VNSQGISQYVVNFRYWRADGNLVQLQAEFNDIDRANGRVIRVISECKNRGLEYLAEIFPRLSDPIVYGSAMGLRHRRELL